MEATPYRPLKEVLLRPPSYGVNAAAVPLRMGVSKYIRITDINQYGEYAPDPEVGVSHPAAAKYLLRRGELVFARTGASVGKSYLYNTDDGPLVYAGFLINVAPNPEVLLPEFLALYVQTQEYWDWVVRTSMRSGQPGINGAEYGSLPVPVPDITIQHGVVATLSNVAALIQTQQREIAKKRDIRRGVQQQLLTGRARLDGFDKPWSSVLLGDCVSYVKNVALSRAQLDHDSTVKYLHYGDIHTRESVRLDAVLDEMPRARDELLSGAGLLAVGDLVFADASEDPEGVGKSVEIVAVPDAGVVAGLHTIAARFDKSVLADGFKAYMQFIPEFREQLLRLVAGTKVLATTRSNLSSIELLLPSVREQDAIVDVLRDSDREIELLEERLQKTRALKTGMLQTFLAARTTHTEKVAS